MRVLMEMHFGRRKVFRAGKSTRKPSLRTDAKGQPDLVMTPHCQEKPLRRSQGTRTVNGHT